MRKLFRRDAWRRYLGVLVLIAMMFSPRRLMAQSSEVPGVDKPVEEAFHNIQVFRGMPQSELLPTMHLMRASLGVRCDYCHVAENGMYWKDEKPAKVTARKMIRMVEDINKNFGGDLVVTCNSCHRGNIKTVASPSVTQAAFSDTTRTPADAAPPQVPSLETILKNYTVGIGREEALSKLNSRLIKMTVSRPRLVDPQQIPIPIEIYEKAPDKILVITHIGAQTVRGAFDGSTSWTEAEGKSRDMSLPEQARLLSLLSMYPLGQIQDLYRNLKVVGQERIDDKTSTYAVEGIAKDNKRQKLFFDSQTGLLVRRISYTRRRIGEDPEQIDFSDYREVDGIKIPFRVSTSYVDNNHLNTVRVITSVENNVAVADAQFSIPIASR